MTFAEFEQLPDPRAGRHELRHGQLILVAPHNHGLFVLRSRICRLLEATTVEERWIASTSMPFQPQLDYEFRYADVGLISTQRWDATDPEGYIQGAPALVAEVLSPSNTAAEILDKRQTCLESGAREFWLVNPGRTTVEVSTPDGHSVIYGAGQQVPLFFGGSIAVDEIFR